MYSIIFSFLRDFIFLLSKLMIGLFFLGLYVGTPKTFAQDIIIKTDGAEISSMVMEITSESIKYKAASNPNGPIRNIDIQDVFMIIYQNGTREQFGNRIQPTQHTQSLKTNSPTRSRSKQKTTQQSNFLSLGTGIGRSYGGLGLQVQYTTGDEIRVGFHGGIGYHPFMEQICFSVGTKVYFFEGLYVGGQFGLLGELPVERTEFRTYSEWEDGERSVYTEPYTYTAFYDSWGPSTMVGFDWFPSEHLGINAAAGLSMDILDFAGSIFLAVDAGILYRF